MPWIAKATHAAIMTVAAIRWQKGRRAKGKLQIPQGSS
jgi:hypothetical protein